MLKTRYSRVVARCRRAESLLADHGISQVASAAPAPNANVEDGDAGDAGDEASDGNPPVAHSASEESD